MVEKAPTAPCDGAPGALNNYSSMSEEVGGQSYFLKSLVYVPFKKRKEKEKIGLRDPI